MKRLIAALSMTAAIVTATPAFPNDGFIQYSFIDGSGPNGRPCIFFYTDFDWQWYAIPKSDPMFEALAAEFLRRAHSNKKLQHSVGNGVPECGGVPAAIYLGGFN